MIFEIIFMSCNEIHLSDDFTLYHLSQICGILGIVALFFYVNYTRNQAIQARNQSIVAMRTFDEIKKQTDYMLNAYVVPVSSIIESLQKIELSSKSILYDKYVDGTIASEWQQFLLPHFSHLDEKWLQGDYFTLDFSNYSNTVVNKIIFKACLTIEHSKEVAKKLNQNPKVDHEIDFEISEVLRPEITLVIPLIPTAAFPKFKITVTGSYFDIRGKEYSLPIINHSKENGYLLKFPIKDDLPF